MWDHPRPCHKGKRLNSSPPAKQWNVQQGIREVWKHVQELHNLPPKANPTFSTHLASTHLPRVSQVWKLSTFICTTSVVGLASTFWTRLTWSLYCVQDWFLAGMKHETCMWYMPSIVIHFVGTPKFNFFLLVTLIGPLPPKNQALYSPKTYTAAQGQFPHWQNEFFSKIAFKILHLYIFPSSTIILWYEWWNYSECSLW